MLLQCVNLLPKSSLLVGQSRSVAKIPPWEYHIRFDNTVGRKIPNQDILNRFKRLNNGIWIRGNPGRHIRRYRRDEPWLTNSLQHYTCTKTESHILDRLCNNFWLRPKYYIDDPYSNYHVRHNLGNKAPRVDYGNRMTRERPKILLDDTTADRHFYDR